jgi:hypothetical protein
MLERSKTNIDPKKADGSMHNAILQHVAVLLNCDPPDLTAKSATKRHSGNTQCCYSWLPEGRYVILLDAQMLWVSRNSEQGILSELPLGIPGCAAKEKQRQLRNYSFPLLALGPIEIVDSCY